MSGQCPRNQEISMSAPHFSPWTEAAPLVFISGQLPFDASGQIPHADVAQQTTQALQNLEAIVAKAGLGLQNIVPSRRGAGGLQSLADRRRSRGESRGATPDSQRPVRPASCETAGKGYSCLLAPTVHTAVIEPADQ
jgi:hypothetical protein